MRLFTKYLALGSVGCVAVALAVAGARSQPPTGTGGDKGKADTPPPGKNAPRFDAARFLKDHDKNNDGKLSKDELPAAAQGEFTQMDTDKDGFISLAELQQHADRMAKQRPQLVEVLYYEIDVPEEPLSIKQLQMVYDQLRKLDKNNDGKIDDAEVKACRDQRQKQRIDDLFGMLDKNKDGKISKDEARGLWADDFAVLDTNKDGFLDRKEVETALTMHTSDSQPKPTPPSKK